MAPARGLQPRSQNFISENIRVANPRSSESGSNAGARGIEPLTTRFGDEYSTNWATPLILFFYCIS